MIFCWRCHLPTLTGESLCAACKADKWGIQNAIACDFFHRGVVRPAGPEDRYEP